MLAFAHLIKLVKVYRADMNQNRRNFLKAALTIGVFGHPLLTNLSCSFAARRPNIVFILIDDMGWKDLGSFGAKLYETPNIDALCNEGIKFTQAYTSTAICGLT